MPAPDPPPWIDRLAGTLRRYDEELVRKVAGRLVRPRNLWPVEDLIARCLDTLANPPVLHRRLGELAPPPALGSGRGEAWERGPGGGGRGAASPQSWFCSGPPCPPPSGGRPPPG